jgi:FKBP-type peptidyl-prolyl cis-trans isomerase
MERGQNISRDELVSGAAAFGKKTAPGLFPGAEVCFKIELLHFT